MGKSGGGGHTPSEARESGRSNQLVKIVEIISEGEVEGLVDGLKSVYLDNTPVINQDGSYNFANLELEGRVGSQVQDIISGFNTSEKEVSVSTQVRKTTPITRTVTDNKVSRLRLTLGVQSLYSQNDQGDTNPTHVNLEVKIGSAVYPITISGKYSSQYLQQHIFGNLPPTPFTITVTRLSDDSKTQRTQNNTVWASYTEIIDTELTYPNTALIGVKFDSEYFSNIPTRTYEMRGIKVAVPSNYDPITRRYDGMWDGTFKTAWTDNPAWILMDIVKTKRYGLGERLGEFTVDKWALYQVAQYCDHLVPDGFGGQEPRFTCNAWITEQRQAYDVISDICSIFRALPVWNGRELTVVMDRPADPVWTYTNANVEQGEFTYTFTAKKARHNAIQVEYADKDNAYEKTIEYVSDDEAIRANGLNVKKVTAFGCTSRGQAHRTGLWILQTEKLETKTVSFTVGAEGLMHTPGDIIKVADVDYAGTNIGGRVLGIDGKSVTLDREIEITANSYFTYINGQAKHKDIKIKSVSGSVVILEDEPTGLDVYGVWSLTTQKVNVQLFRALSVKEASKGKFTITALQHEPQKEAIVDNGAVFESKSTSLLSTPKINNIDIVVNPDGSVSFAGDATGGDGLVTYDIRIYKDGSLYSVTLGQKSPSLDLDNLSNGNYSVVIWAKNDKGQLLNEKTQHFKIDRPPAPTNIVVTGGLGNVTLEWDWINDATATEIFVSESDDITTAKRLTKVTAKMYTHEVGAKQTRYYWLRHVRGINVGPFSQESGIKGQSSVDIAKELEVLNAELKERLGKELNAIVEVNNDTFNPAENVGKYIYHSDKNEFYSWVVDKYEPIAVEAEKVVGKLTARQIAANAIEAEHIASRSVTTDKIAVNAITANEIATGAVGANEIAANSINSIHVAARSITSDKVSVSDLSAISANLGRITTGTLVGTRIEGNIIEGGHIQGTDIQGVSIRGSTIEGNTINGSTINGGVINGAHINGITVEADNIIGDVVKTYVISVEFERYHDRWGEVVIPQSKKRRYVSVVPMLANMYYTTVYKNAQEMFSSSNRMNGSEYALLQGGFWIEPYEMVTLRVKTVGTIKNESNIKHTLIAFLVSNA